MVQTNKNRILSILRTIDRPGMDRVIEFLIDSNYFTANCYGHHYIGKGGVAQHSLEVMDYLLPMGRHFFPKESIIIVSIFHDLGKSAGRYDSRFHGAIEHPANSVAILDYCGLQLTSEERFAILNHHNCESRTLFHPLRALLSVGDCLSTGKWKKAHSE